MASYAEPPQTLHTALDAYANSFLSNSRRRISACTKRRRIGIVERLKRYHEDIPLPQLDLDVCIFMIDMWQRRPISQKTGRPFAGSTSQSTLPELIQFLGWLDTSDQFEWNSPTFFGQISRRVRKLPGD